MSLNRRLKDLLQREKVDYEVIPHREAFTAQEVAQVSHVKGRFLAKVLVLRDPDTGTLMAVVPADRALNLSRIRDITGRMRLDLVPEADFQGLFPDCEAGAMPPFGCLYDMPVYMDAAFPKQQEIDFQAGNHHELIRMSYLDFERLVCPCVVDIATYPLGFHPSEHLAHS